MIAYVFWHAPDAGEDRASYEAELLRFHDALRAMSVEGFISSRSFAVDALPWVPQPQSYEDWYLLADSCGLDSINEAAISAAAQAPHARVASKAIFGAGGVYRHRSGETGKSAPWAYWFAKPTGMAYAQLFDIVTRSAPEAILWQRQMVLGPGLEFCLHSTQPIELPPAIQALCPTRRPLA